MTLPLQANLLGWPFAAAQCIVEEKKESAIAEFSYYVMRKECLEDTTIVPKFTNTYRDWIESSKLNQITGLDKFPTVAYSQGTSESFDKFYLKHNTRRFRCFRGEYMYHRLAWENYFPNYKYIDDIPNTINLENNDAVVVSWPFADTGDTHPLFGKEFLDECYAKGIPVLIDCAFFGICSGMTFNFDHPAITDICFSLSKSFPLHHLRIGIRFTKEDDNDSLLVYHKTQYVNRYGAALGILFMENWSPDIAVETWHNKQIEWCKKMNLQPSSTVIFGIDTQHLYPHYNRGMIDTNRLCFAKFYESDILPEDIRV